MKDWKELYFKEYQSWFDNHLDGSDVADIIERQVSFIDNLLSQQRKEVLEEVLKEIPSDMKRSTRVIKSLINKQ